MHRLHVTTGHGQGPLFTMLAGAAEGAALAWSLFGGGDTDADVLGAPVDVPAGAGTAHAIPQMMRATSGLCLYDELAELQEGFHGRPQQHQRAHTPRQRG